MKVRRRIRDTLRPSIGAHNSRVREEWLASTLQRVPAGNKILDAGAGTQRYRKFCRHLEYVSQDFGEYDGLGDGAGLQAGQFDYGDLDIVSDITSIPEPDASFDAIMCVEVLEHVPNPLSALKEFARLLRPNGSLIITAPFCSLTHYAPYHFSTGFSRYWYKAHLEPLGFEIVELQANGSFFEYMAQEVNRISATAKRYSGERVSLLEHLALLVVQRMLDRFSKRDAGSSELLCFGYHILARRLKIRS